MACSFPYTYQEGAEEMRGGEVGRQRRRVARVWYQELPICSKSARFHFRIHQSNSPWFNDNSSHASETWLAFGTLGPLVQLCVTCKSPSKDLKKTCSLTTASKSSERWPMDFSRRACGLLWYQEWPMGSKSAQCFLSTSEIHRSNSPWFNPKFFPRLQNLIRVWNSWTSLVQLCFVL